jgi:hypothetical protein
LTVTDAFPGVGSFGRLVTVLAPLGTLHVSVRNLAGGIISTPVVVKLYNYTSPVPPLCKACSKTTNLGGTIDFRGLSPGVYTLNFTGPGVDPGGKQTQVQVGWPTMETVYLTEKQPPAPNTIYLEIFGAVIGGGLGLVGLVLFVRSRRNGKLLKTSGSIRKVRKSGRS